MIMYDLSLSRSSLATPQPPAPLTRLRGDQSVSLSPSSSAVSGNRLGEYHRSKQNPAVLDHYLSPNTTSQLSGSLYKNSPTVHANSDRFSLFPSPHGTTGFPPSRRVQTPLRSSLFHSRGHGVSPFGTSLVSMAVRGRLRQSQSTGVSPVIVQLSNSSSPSQTGLTGRDEGTQQQGDTLHDPCNKDVVISALKQKRKRWACQGEDVTGNTDSQPAAKRSRYIQ